MEYRNAIVTELRSEVVPGRTYFALAAASCAIATFGLLENSSPVIIGAMLIAPLMTPIVGLALAIVGGEFVIFRNAFLALAFGSVLAVGFSAFIALAVGLPTPGSEILGRGHPNLLDLGIALSAGAIAGYARVQKSIAETVGGASIAVALMPPLCVIGIGLSLRNWELSYGAFLLFATNLVGITFACALVFMTSGFAVKSARRGVITTAIVLILIAVPLGYATSRLIEEQRLEAVLRSALVHDTQTFRRVALISTTFDWLANPLRVELFVRAQGAVTPVQVGFLQSFAESRIKRTLQLVVDVSSVEAVSAPPAPAPSP